MSILKEKFICGINSHVIDLILILIFKEKLFFFSQVSGIDKTYFIINYL